MGRGGLEEERRGEGEGGDRKREEERQGRMEREWEEGD